MLLNGSGFEIKSTPITGNPFACCARSASGHAATLTAYARKTRRSIGKVYIVKTSR
jgi:hypothetical protein